ncbi:MAG: hypothetical protein QXV32_06185 [Conexivisphaerales archaeon]
MPRKEKKVFFRDPFILRTISAWTSTPFLESALPENVVQEYFYRKMGQVYCYRNHYEVDVVAGDSRIEVKAGRPHRTYPKGVIILKENDIPKFLANE